MTRALLALGRGDVRAAWTFNPGSVAVAPILVWNGFRKIKELLL
jgi:hypothetical protein